MNLRFTSSIFMFGVCICLLAVCHACHAQEGNTPPVNEPATLPAARQSVENIAPENNTPQATAPENNTPQEGGQPAPQTQQENSGQQNTESNSGPLDIAQSPENSKPPANQMADDMVRMYQSENLYSLRLIANMASNHESNFVISPYGAYECLNFLKVAVGAEAESEIARGLELLPNRSYATELAAIRISHLPPPPVAPQGNGQTQTANPVRVSPFVTQNVLLLDHQLRFAEGVADRVIAPFRTVPIGVDWTNEQSKADASARINQIFGEATSGRLTEISYNAPALESGSTSLVNLCYFEASWLNEFDVSLTQPGPFMAAGAPVADVQFMNAPAQTSFYFENEICQLVELPYQGSSMAMVVVLPAEGATEMEVMQSLAEAQCMGPRANRPQGVETVKLQIPRFTFKTNNIDLVSSTRALGVNAIFQEGCELERMFDVSTPMYVSDMRQNAFIRVDEKGTEAAAVTEIDMIPMSAPEEPTKQFVANRPFMFFVVDANGGIYFGGRVANPVAN